MKNLYMSSTTARVAAFLILLTASGCSTWDKLNNKEKGAVIGGGTGVVVGNAVAPGLGGTVVGGAAGALTGGVVGNEMDKNDRRHRRY